MTNQSQLKTVLITGASSGIGFEFAKMFAKNNYNLILTGRNIQKLEECKNELEQSFNSKIITLSKDLSIIEETYSVYNYLIDNNIKIDVLINNAGFGVYGDFSETDFQKEYDMINVNISSLTYLTKFILKDMLKNNSGSIINVASTAAFKPGPMMSVYYATKAYVLSFSESIYAEIKKSNVTLTVLCPGPTDTEFFNKSTDSKVKDLKIKKLQSPCEVALFGFNAMNKKKLIAIPGINNQIITQLLKFFPRKLFADIMYKLKKRT